MELLWVSIHYNAVILFRVGETVCKFISAWLDDLTCGKMFPLSAPDALISELAAQQVNIHQWGAANRLEFDPKKEEMKIIHPRLGVGTAFKFLGVMTDCKLTMIWNVSASFEGATKDQGNSPNSFL